MSSEHGKHTFKEWLSDNLRYIVLIICIILGITAIVFGVRIYQNMNRQSAMQDEQSTDQEITIISQGEDESETVTSQQTVLKDTEAASEKMTETEKETETEKATEKQTESETMRQTEKQTESETVKQTESETARQTERQTESETVKQTERQTEEMDTLKTYSDSTTLYAEVESNIRSGPGTEYSIIGTASEGDELTITGETSGWYQLRYDGKTGYIAKSLTTSVYIAPEPVYRTIISACNVRSEPSYGDNVIIYDLPAGTQVEYLGGSGWCEIKLSDGTVGYVGEKFLG